MNPSAVRVVTAPKSALPRSLNIADRHGSYVQLKRYFSIVGSVNPFNSSLIAHGFLAIESATGLGKDLCGRSGGVSPSRGSNLDPTYITLVRFCECQPRPHLQVAQTVSLREAGCNGINYRCLRSCDPYIQHGTDADTEKLQQKEIPKFETVYGS